MQFMFDLTLVRFDKLLVSAPSSYCSEKPAGNVLNTIMIPELEEASCNLCLYICMNMEYGLSYGYAYPGYQRK